ncbi:hypothetical protein JAO82_11715 [Pontibaca sp. S1109L]|uniref:Uncharacterized protein n=1 Tax=Pontibaca salina TaxID=2795731 RepID=A0A934HLZ1_9RHOB|nr:hypothetical protein [Pontibaca salina]
MDSGHETNSQKTQEQRDTATAVRIMVGVFAFLLAWGASVVTWGLPGLYLPAVGLVPVVYVMLLLITRG